MSVIKACIIAFGTYSKLPVPFFEWKEKDMKYSICFFPLVGIVTGMLEYFWLWLCNEYDFSDILKVSIGIVINIVITGGIHIDGYMDTMDALHSYQPREKKLEILKDAHIGAFAVIMLLVYLLVYAGVLSEIDLDNAGIYSGTFVLSRILSGLSVVWFKSAKSDGMLYAFSSSAHKKAARGILISELILISGCMVYFGGIRAVITVAVSFFVFIYYRYKSYKEFGGITGDLAGWFLCLCEVAAAIVCAIGG